MPLIHLWEDVSTFKPEILARAPDLKESYQLNEKDSETLVKGLMKIRGVFQRYDCINANGRKYEKVLWERVLKDERVLESINSGSMHGLTEHPEDGKTRLDRGITIIVTKIWDDNKGNIMGEAVIPATSAGKDVAAIIEAGGSIGVSSRADGEVEMVSEGYQRVKPETFTLITWDVVSDNSVPGARPIAVRESAESITAPKPAIGTVTESSSQEPKTTTTIMSKIGEMRKLDLAISGLKRPDFKKLGLNSRAAIYESSLELSAAVTKLMVEDPTLASYGNKILAKSKLIEDEMDAPVEDPSAPPPPPAPGGEAAPGGEGAGEPEVDEDSFVKVVTKVLKDLCPECDDLKIGEQASAMFAKFAEGEPLGIQSTCDLLREMAAGGGEGGPGDSPAPAAGGTDAPPSDPADNPQMESALSIIRAMSEGTVSKAKHAELEKILKESQTKLAEFDKTKERLSKNLQLLKESADYIEKTDKDLEETKAILEAAIKLLKEHKIDDASILSMVEKKKKDDDAEKLDGKDNKKAKDEAGEDAEADEIGKKKAKDEAVAAETEKAKLAEAEKAKAEALALKEAKAKEEFAKINDGKKTIKDIEEAMNAMFTDVDWKKMVNFTEATKGLTESVAPEPHDFVRQMGRLRSGAFNQLASNNKR